MTLSPHAHQSPHREPGAARAFAPVSREQPPAPGDLAARDRAASSGWPPRWASASPSRWRPIRLSTSRSAGRRPRTAPARPLSRGDHRSAQPGPGPAVSIRLGGGVRFGAAPAFCCPSGRAERGRGHRPPPARAAALQRRNLRRGERGAAARYDVSSGFDFFDGSLSLRRGGRAAHRSPELDVRRDLHQPAARHPQRHGDQGAGDPALSGPARRRTPLCPAETGGCVYSEAVYQLPDTLMAGLDVPLDARWLVGRGGPLAEPFTHDAVRMRVTGPATGSLRTLGLPQEVVLHRGLRDVLDLRAAGRSTGSASGCSSPPSCAGRADPSAAGPVGGVRRRRRRMEPGLAAACG